MRPGLQERRHHLETSLPPEPVHLRADPVRLTQVLANLLNNAIRYTDEGGHIQLTCVLEGDHIEMSIVDNGRGIPAELLPRIFDMFVQERDGGGGLGLGLTLVERLVDLHGGTVTAHSDGPGKGARFTVRIPLGHTAEAAQAATAAAETSNGHAMRALSMVLVEDNVDIRETMSELLTVWGHSVQVADDGPSGVELILRVKPDLALVDLGLPGFDGYTVATEVRKPLSLGQHPAGGHERLRPGRRSQTLARGGLRRPPRQTRRHERLDERSDAFPGAMTYGNDDGIHQDQRSWQQARQAGQAQQGGRRHPRCDRRQILAGLRALPRGEFDARLPDDLDGVDGQICETFNELAQFAGTLRGEVVELRQSVGREGRTHRRLGAGNTARRLGATT